VRDISDAIVGFALAGPKSRELLESLTSHDLSNASLPFMGCAEFDVGLIRAKVGRLSVEGELGYELNCSAAEHATLYRMLKDVGRKFDAVDFGFNAMNSMRLEKSFGIWSREFTQGFTPGMCGLDRFIAFDKGDFVGREAALRERDGATARQTLVTLEVDSVDADASGFEPVWQGDHRIGFVTSGAYGHTVGESLAMAYVDRHLAGIGTELSVHIVGDLRPCRVIAPSPHDPEGRRLRA
jgi:dimethylglycine dehydrogenase